MFDNARDANQYLSNTVCYWNGAPFYVESVNPEMEARGYLLPINNASLRMSVDVRDVRFNCREFKLGYVNTAWGFASYVSRVPVRGLSQGIGDNNLRFEGNGVDAAGRHQDVFVQNLLRDQGFADMLNGVYPDRAEVERRLADPAVLSVAVSPWVSIKKHTQFRNLFYLEYKGREIAWSETDRFALPPEFNYLREIIQPTGTLG
jgi:hypothetical protein